VAAGREAEAGPEAAGREAEAEGEVAGREAEAGVEAEAGAAPEVDPAVFISQVKDLIV